ncbi:MAG: hypothetical protein R6V72_02005 [Cyclobacterium sp.]|uniref:hypothetical protein n=1 Tax=unclassified Cyclobacterium TaxID=2615055 RepID=UPI001969C774|nr:hypothetical protein [Cyclobacterium sp. SYSU L10401]
MRLIKKTLRSERYIKGLLPGFDIPAAKVYDYNNQAMLDKNIPIHTNGHLAAKGWGQKEFSLLDPDNNLLTFGQNL